MIPGEKQFAQGLRAATLGLQGLGTPSPPYTAALLCLPRRSGTYAP